MLWNLRLDLSRQGALYLDEEAILRYAVGGPTEPRVLAVLDDANFMRLASGSLIVQVPDERFKERPMLSRGVSAPLGLENLLFHKRVGRLVVIITDRTRDIARRNHILAQIKPFLGSLLRVRRREKFPDPKNRL